MAEVILEEIRLQFEYGETLADPIGLVAGETYLIVWDGTEYTDTATQTTLLGYQAIVVGNAALAGGEESGDYPFLLGDVVDIGAGYLISEDTEATAHTVAIYTASEEEEFPYDSNDISLKRYSGEDRIYEDVEVVHLMHASGEGTVPYSRGRAIENVPITLDLQNGDQLVTAPDGTLVKSAIIAKPEDLSPENVRYGKVIANVRGEFIGDTEELIIGESDGSVPLDWSGDDQVITPGTDGKAFSKVTLEKPTGLKPENIAKDVVIGGITGTFEGGGAALPLVSDSGEFKIVTAGGSVTISHKMGVVPDQIFYGITDATSGTGLMIWVNGYSTEVASLLGLDTAQNTQYKNGTSIGYKYGINNDNEMLISDANPMCFSVLDSAVFTHLPNVTYKWFALGGLVPHNDVLYLRLTLDRSGTLAVTGGVPEIEQILVYCGNELVKTVDYICSKEFVIDVSDVEGMFTNSCVFTVKAVGTDLESIYPKQYYDRVFNNVTAGGTCGENANWTLYDDGTLYIFGEGAMADYTAASAQPWYIYASGIRSVEIQSGITHLASYSFRDCVNLASISLPDTVSTIGNNCLRNTALTSIVIPNGVSTLPLSMVYGCASLTNVDIPDSVTSIGNYAFYNCSALTSIDLPNSLTSIGAYAFFGCSALTSIVIPDGVSFGETSDGFTNIFYNCTNLKEVILPADLTKIGTSCFYGCASLTSIDLPNSLTSIGTHAFRNCSALTNINLPDSLTSIGAYAFHSCSALTSIAIPDGVTTFGGDSSTGYWQTFRGCSNLSEVRLPAGLTSIGGCMFYDCTSLKSITIPDSVTSIGDYAFRGSGLTSVIIPVAVNRIGKYAFAATSIATATFRDTTTWYRTSTAGATTGGTSTTVTNTTTAATYLKSTYSSYYWYKT